MGTKGCYRQRFVWICAILWFTRMPMNAHELFMNINFHSWSFVVIRVKDHQICAILWFTRMPMNAHELFMNINFHSWSFVAIRVKDHQICVYLWFTRMPMNAHELVMNYLNICSPTMPRRSSS